MGELLPGEAYSFLSNAGATLIVIALLVYARHQAMLMHERSKLQHERSLARDKMMLEAITSLQIALIECVKENRNED